jgi:orotidine-5'-phosphate decarboxylase
MFKKKLESYIKNKNSLLCIGLDCDLASIPPFLLNEPDPLLKFNREIIEATSDLVVAYKPNIAFYETLGSEGWNLLEKTLSLIPSDNLIIADAKRADIGNTSRKYAELYFQNLNVDAITVAPYMGYDSIQPFIEFDDKGIFVLCLTSNRGAEDFQYLTVDSEPLYLKIARKVNEWNLKFGNCGLVVGATHPENLDSIRELSPHLPFLIPGIGTQGGNLEMTVRYGTDSEAGCTLINVGRKIIYASDREDFAQAAREMTLNFNHQINEFRTKKLYQ